MRTATDAGIGLRCGLTIAEADLSGAGLKGVDLSSMGLNSADSLAGVRTSDTRGLAGLKAGVVDSKVVTVVTGKTCRR